MVKSEFCIAASIFAFALVSADLAGAQTPDAAQVQSAQGVQDALPANSLIQIRYEEPRNPAQKPIQERLQARRVLEQLRDFLTPLRLPVPLTLRVATCGSQNAYYSRASRTVTMCYEFITFARDLVPDEKATCELGIVPEDVIVGQFVDILLHETAHALFHIFRIPVFGREEDAADQLAALMLLQFGPDVARRTVTATAIFLRELAKQGAARLQARATPDGNNSQFDMVQFASEHGTPAQRFYNVLCIAYGFDKDLFDDFVREGLLPVTRAGRCRSEYIQVAEAFRTLVNPHIDLQYFIRTHPPGRQWLPQSTAKCG